MTREADRQELPVLLRRDVRLLGDLLGEVIRESGGQDLLDDVERLRRAVIAARAKPPGDEADLAGDEIAALVAGWPLARAPPGRGPGLTCAAWPVKLRRPPSFRPPMTPAPMPCTRPRAR